MEKKGLKVVNRRIEILENRLQKINVDSWNSEVFSHSQYCLYVYLLLGEYSNRYYLLTQDLQRQKEDWEVDHPEKPFPDPGDEWRDAIIQKSWSFLETGYRISEENLKPTDSIHLILTYEYCCFLWRYGEEKEEAKRIATSTYETASELSFDLSGEQLSILGKIREDLLVSKRPPGLFQSFGEQESADDEESKLDDQDQQDENRKNTRRISRKKSVKFAEIDKLRESRQSFRVFNQNLEIVANIKRSLGAHGIHPTLLDNIPSSSILLKTIDKVFRAYIRGNALPGQLASGNTVELAGNNISFGTFLLNGPYMSWKGFLQFLIDFGIAQMPAQNSRSGQKIFRTMSSKNINPEEALSDQAIAGGGNNVEPVLTLKEAALIFIQSSSAGYPQLISRRSNRQRSDNDSDDDGAFNPDTSEAESWRLVSQWAENEGDSEWEIDVGTNFPQFLDCLGKMGIVAFSNDHFASILPSASEKIQHFLSAFLGLTDQRKWFTKVQRKLKSATSAIKDVAERAKAVTSNKKT